LPRADLYLQDEIQFAFHPTLTRVWSRKGRRGQRLIQAPGDNRKVYGFGLVDWREGWFDGRTAPGRTADVCCRQERAADARPRRWEPATARSTGPPNTSPVRPAGVMT